MVFRGCFFLNHKLLIFKYSILRFLRVRCQEAESALSINGVRNVPKIPLQRSFGNERKCGFIM